MSTVTTIKTVKPIGIHYVRHNGLNKSHFPYQLSNTYTSPSWRRSAQHNDRNIELSTTGSFQNLSKEIYTLPVLPQTSHTTQVFSKQDWLPWQQQIEILTVAESWGGSRKLKMIKEVAFKRDTTSKPFWEQTQIREDMKAERVLHCNFS